MTKYRTNTTPLFPDFHLSTLRRSPRSAQQKRREELDKLSRKRLDHLANLFKEFIPSDALFPKPNGEGSRERHYSQSNTFWAFLQQVWSGDGSCQEAVHRIIELAEAKGMKSLPSTNTSAYTQARKRLVPDDLWHILYHGAGTMEQEADALVSDERRWIVIDGTSFSMPDTEENQEKWPQPSNQQPGIGFPVMKAVASFSLSSGAILDAETGSLNEHELSLFRRMYSGFTKGDILLGDRGFCGWQTMMELQEQGVDTVFRLHGMRKVVDAKHAVKRLGEGDLLIRQPRPFWQAKSGYDKEVWNAMPKELLLRQVSFRVNVPGFRSEVVHLVTTLIDPVKYPKKLLMRMYLRRWRIEVVFRDIKCSMGWELMRCKTPEMIQREFVMMLIGYNAVRYLQLKAASREEIALDTISFKSTLQVLRVWEKRFRESKEKQRETMDLMLQQIASVRLPNRPERAEPRVKKRRPKKVRLMTKSRRELKQEMLKKVAA